MIRIEISDRTQADINYGSAKQKVMHYHHEECPRGIKDIGGDMNRGKGSFRLVKRTDDLVVATARGNPDWIFVWIDCPCSDPSAPL